VESTPRAYRLKAGNAASPISTFSGAIPTKIVELVNTGRRGKELTDEALRFFEPERLTGGDSPTPKPALDLRSGG
jgi:hypothetical protein